MHRVEISRDQTVLFGSSPKCDIVLTGEGVLPFHGRMRWRTERYKVDAFPAAEFLEVNGRRMTSASVREGDEITVGPCRIFMIYADEDLPRDDATRVMATPVLLNPSASNPPAASSRPRPALPVERKEEKVKPKKEESKKRESGFAAEDALGFARSSKKEARAEQAITDAANAKSKGQHPNALKRFFSGRQSAPGEETILNSPLIIGLVGSLAVLIVAGIFLQGVISRTITTRLFQRGVESLDDGDYRNAILRFEEYLERKPKDAKNVSKARVFRALANVRQFTTASGASWSNALDAAREMIDTVSDEPAYVDSSTDLDDQVIKAGEALADRAKISGDPKVLAEAESARALHARITGSAAEELLKHSKYLPKLAEARAAVVKAGIRTKALAAMDAAITAGSSAGVYEARDTLVHQYADLAEDRDLVARLKQANELVRKAVKLDPSRRPAEKEPHDDKLGPLTSLVMRWPNLAKPTSPSTSRVFALADGIAYGLDGGSGAPLWQYPVGLSSAFPPQAIPGGSTALVFDGIHQELVRLDARTGALVWRQGTEEPITDPPLVLGNQVIQATPSGKLLFLDLNSGEIRGTLNLGLPLGRTPVSDEAGQFLYVLAERDCLFILTRDPLACASVEYLGHPIGSVLSPPSRQGRYLIIPENDTLLNSRWRIFVLDAEGAKIRPVQQIEVPGWTWSAPGAFGSVLWTSGDRGGLSAYAVGAYEAKTPLRPIAKLVHEAKPTGPTFALARSETEVWLSSSRSGRYDLNPETGQIRPTWSIAEAGPALAPIQLAGPLAVLTQQISERPGVLVCGVEPQKGTVRWRTVLGSPWVVQPTDANPSKSLTTLGIDGQTIALEPDQLKAGGFIETLLPRPGEFSLPPGPLRRLDGDNFTILLAGDKPRSLLLGGPQEPFRWVELPVALAATPIVWQKGLLLPGEDGRVYLIDPRTGQSRAEPYVPPFDREHPTLWRGALRLEDDTIALVDESGRLRRLTLHAEGRPRLVVNSEVNLKEPLSKDPVSTGGAVVITTVDNRVRSLAARDFSPVGAWPLSAPLAQPPLAIDGRAFIATRDGKVLALAPDGQRLWSITLKNGTPLGPPVLREETAYFLCKNGTVESRSLNDGVLLDQIPLGSTPGGDLVGSGSQLLIPVAAGSLRVLSSPGTSQSEGAKP